jgi:hypothetical protein
MQGELKYQAVQPNRTCEFLDAAVGMRVGRS